MSDSRWYLLCYDVRDDKRLRRAAKHLEGYGERLQYSVFRCWLSSAQARRLRWELTTILASEDDLLVIPLCSRCVEGIARLHQDDRTRPWPDEPPRSEIV